MSLPQGHGPKNYLQYNSGGAYDDDQYSSYATSGYETERLEMLREEPSNEAKALEFHRESRLPPITAPKKGFEVVNKEAPKQTGSPPPQGGNSLPQGVNSLLQGGNYYACPVCSNLAVKTCGCRFRDAGCANGHTWFMSDGQRVLGISPGHAPQPPVPARGVVYSE